VAELVEEDHEAEAQEEGGETEGVRMEAAAVAVGRGMSERCMLVLHERVDGEARPTVRFQEIVQGGRGLNQVTVDCMLDEASNGAERNIPGREGGDGGLVGGVEDGAEGSAAAGDVAGDAQGGEAALVGG